MSTTAINTPPPLPASVAAVKVEPPSFRAALRRFQLRWQGGLFVAGIFRTLTWSGIALLALGLLDFYAGFSDPMRRVAATVIAAAATLAALLGLWQTLRFLRRDAAIAADRALRTDRREVLAALELQRSADPSQADALANWLKERTIRKAARELAALSGVAALPVRKISRQAWRTVAVIVPLAVCAIVFPVATWTITTRLLRPAADIPPYSPLVFELGPKPAEVIYGADIVVTAEISGGDLDGTVRCLTRDPATGKIDDSPAYHEGSSRFSRKLEKVAVPVEVAFAVNRARSAWLPISVLMQPKVQEVLLTVQPPAYSKLPVREFLVGTQDLIALPGSRITAKASSNRPLNGGALQIESVDSNLPSQEIAGETEATHHVRFSWTVRNPGRIALKVRDVVGTFSEALVVDQRVAADERPEVILRQPAGDVLATPETELTVEASASDDLGLTRFAIVRQLRGYRERAQAQSVANAERRHELQGKLNLAAFGLQPGHVIELAVEAGDTNPNLLGVGTSEPARVHIIATEQYAELLRNQTTLEDFAGRYEALRDALEAARKSLEKLEEAAKSGDAEAIEAARKAALESHREAGKIFGDIAKDFPLFDLDAGLSQAAGGAMEKLFENAKDLQELGRALPNELLAAVPQLKDRLGKGAEEMAAEMKQGERAVAAAEVFEQAGRFREWLNQQRDLVKSFNRTLEQIRRGETQAGEALRDLGRQQREIGAGIRQLQSELDSALNGLPEEFSKMAEEGREFLQGLSELKIPSTMDEGAAAAEKGDGKTAGDRAGEALAALEALLRRDNGFCEMCRGEGDADSFPWPPDLSKTMEQLMRALIMKPGHGGSGEQGAPDSNNGGGGFGGLSDSGFAMRGKLPQLPIYGPSRQRFSRSANSEIGGRGGNAGGKGDGRPEAGANVNADQLNTAAKQDPKGAAVPHESVPEAYRDAVKRYFSQEPDGGANPSENPKPDQP